MYVAARVFFYTYYIKLENYFISIALISIHSCFTLHNAIYDFLVDKSCHPTGPLSQSAQARYLTLPTVCDTPIFSKVYISSINQ